MTDTAAPRRIDADTRQFTPQDIAVAVAKRVARVGDFDDSLDRPFARHGVELAEDGFTVRTEGGQTFHLAVTEVAAWTPTVGDRVTGVETQNIGQRAVTGYFHSSGVDGLSWLKIRADDPEIAQRHLVATATLKPAPAEPKPRCCIGPFADGTHAVNCWQRCQDCGGDEAGPRRCRCRDGAPAAPLCGCNVPGHEITCPDYRAQPAGEADHG